MGTVSVIIPTWNRALTVERAVRSALAQTVPVTEVLVCDDGSDDETREMVSRMGDSRVMWIPGPHSGKPAVPRNRGIRESRGEWLAFLDSDDEWLPEKTATQLSLMKRLECRAACANALRRLPDGGIAGMFTEDSGSTIQFSDLLRVNRIVTSSVIMHRSLLDCVVGFPEDSALVALEDYALWLRVVMVSRFVFVEAPQVVYMDNPSGSVRSGSAGIWKQRMMVFGDFLEWAALHAGELPDLASCMRGAKWERRRAVLLGMIEPLRRIWRGIRGRR